MEKYTEKGLAVKALKLTPLVQFLVLFVLGYIESYDNNFENSIWESFRCPNFHGDVFDCSIFGYILVLLITLVFLNIGSLGISYIVTAALIYFVLSFIASRNDRNT